MSGGGRKETVGNLIERNAHSTGIPIGGIWLVLLVGGGLIYIVTTNVHRQDLIIGAVMWAFTCLVLWIDYWPEFWMNIKLLKVLCETKREILAEDDE